MGFHGIAWDSKDWFQGKFDQKLAVFFAAPWFFPDFRTNKQTWDQKKYGLLKFSLIDPPQRNTGEMIH